MDCRPWRLRHKISDLVKHWKIRAKVLARDRKRRNRSRPLRRILNSDLNSSFGLDAQRCLNFSPNIGDDEVEDQGEDEPDSQNTSINVNQGGVAGQARGRKRKKVNRKRSLGRRSWLEASKRFKLDIYHPGFESPPPSMPG